MEQSLREVCEEILNSEEPYHEVGINLHPKRDETFMAPGGVGGLRTRWFKVEVVWEEGDKRRRKICRAKDGDKEVYAIHDWVAMA